MHKVFPGCRRARSARWIWPHVGDRGLPAWRRPLQGTGRIWDRARARL